MNAETCRINCPGEFWALLLKIVRKTIPDRFAVNEFGEIEKLLKIYNGRLVYDVPAEHKTIMRCVLYIEFDSPEDYTIFKLKHG